jgi:hypothetical protein
VLPSLLSDLLLEVQIPSSTGYITTFRRLLARPILSWSYPRRSTHPYPLTRALSNSTTGLNHSERSNLPLHCGLGLCYQPGADHLEVATFLLPGTSFRVWGYLVPSGVLHTVRWVAGDVQVFAITMWEDRRRGTHEASVRCLRPAECD